MSQITIYFNDKTGVFEKSPFDIVKPKISNALYRKWYYTIFDNSIDADFEEIIYCLTPPRASDNTDRSDGAV